MANTITVPTMTGQPPAIFQGPNQLGLNQATQANVSAGFAVISYKGRAFKTRHRGEEEMVMDRTNPQAPASVLDVVIIGASAHLAKTYYEKPFVEGSTASPDCFSVDGIRPDASSRAKQNNLCNGCQHNVFGSRITEAGRKGKRCADHRRIAVVPEGDISNEFYDGPMLLQIPPMSLNNLATYSSSLTRRNAPLEAVVTRISFDYTVAYPLLTFTAMRWLTDQEALQVVGPHGDDGMRNHPAIERMLYGGVEMVSDVPATPRDPPPDEPTEEPVGEPQQPPPTPQPDQAAIQQAIAEAQQAAAYANEKEAEQKAAAAARKPRGGAFGGVITPAPSAPPVAVQPAAAPPAAAPPVGQPNGAVPTAPTDIQQAIDALLNAPGAV